MYLLNLWIILFIKVIYFDEILLKANRNHMYQNTNLTGKRDLLLPNIDN